MPLKGRGGPGDRVRLQHMLDAARQARAFVAGRVRADLDTDPLLEHALHNVLQIIGEAAATVTQEGRDRASALPWGQIVAMGHILVHVYWGVDNNRVWETAPRDMPVLIAAIESAVAGWPLPGAGDSATPPTESPPPDPQT